MASKVGTVGLLKGGIKFKAKVTKTNKFGVPEALEWTFGFGGQEPEQAMGENRDSIEFLYG